jgi:DNA-binding PadR family transcriptional regulator
MSRSPKALRTESERRILHFIKTQNPKHARATEIERGTGLGSTCYVVLRQFEREGILEVDRGRRRTIYKWTPKADSLYRDLIPFEIKATRRFYERLNAVVDVHVPPENFIEKLVPAVGMTIVLILLESIKKHQAISLDPILSDFKFFMKKYIAYRHYPALYSQDTQDAREEIGRIGELLAGLDNEPNMYGKEIAEVEVEAEKLRDRMLSRRGKK